MAEASGGSSWSPAPRARPGGAETPRSRRFVSGMQYATLVLHKAFFAQQRFKSLGFLATKIGRYLRLPAPATPSRLPSTFAFRWGRGVDPPKCDALTASDRCAGVRCAPICSRPHQMHPVSAGRRVRDERRVPIGTLVLFVPDDPHESAHFCLFVLFVPTHPQASIHPLSVPCAA